MTINPVLFGVLACIFAQLVLLFGWGFYHRVLKDELNKRKTLLLKAAQMRLSGAKHSGMRLHAEGCENATHDV